MASTLEQFFQKLHEEVVLPSSGLTVTIRHPDLFSLVGIGELPIPTIPQSAETTDAASSTLSMQEINRYTERIIAEGVITPPFSDARDEQGRAIYSQHYVHVCELDAVDKNFLGTRLFEKMGLSPQAAQSAQSFRADEQRQDGASVGDRVQPTPA